MEKTVLTWSVENWITVVLMAFLGTLAVRSVGKLVAARKAKADG